MLTGLVQKFIGDAVVATGEVMVEEAGGDPLVIGEAVTLATRLQAAAGPGEVLLDA